MDIILELLQLIKRDGIKSTKQFRPADNGQLIDRYVYLVLEKNVTTDNDLAHALYGTDKSDARFKNLKKRVKQKLLESIPLMDPEHLGFKSEYNKQYHKCLLTTNILWLLSRKAAYSTIENLIKANYSTACKFEFHDILKDFSYHLIKVYAIKGEEQKVQNETENLNKYIFEEQLILRSQIFYFNSLAGLVKKSNISVKKLDDIEREMKILEASSSNSSSFESKYWIQYTKISYFILMRDIKNLLVTLNELEGIFDKWEFYHPGRQSAFTIQKLSVLFQLKNFEEGLYYANTSEQLFYTHNNNWVLFKKLEFYHAINCDINKALAVQEEVISSGFFQMNNNIATTQLWMINDAYLTFMLHCRKHPAAKQYNIFKFVNEVHVYNKDKAGYNFSILILELLFCLIHDNIDRYIDKMTGLMAYRLRHLKSKAFKRSNVFAQLLLDVDRLKFDPVALRRQSEKKYQYLRSIEDRLNINEWEIVGYDILWEEILKILESR